MLVRFKVAFCCREVSINWLVTGQWNLLQVFPFGSVPLKTYLPDGDIDLTALSHQNVEDALANKVRAVLERMEEDKDAKFEVKDVQYIHAEVLFIFYASLSF